MFFSPRDEERKVCVREREKRASRDGRCGEKNRCVSVVSSSEEEEEEKEKERRREREREMQNRPLSIGWKKIDLSLFSLSLLLIFAPSFLPCFSFFVPCVSRIVVGKREREKKRVLLFGLFRTVMMRSSSSSS